MIRYPIAGLALMMSSVCQGATEREFSERMLARLQAAAPAMELRVSADDPLVLEMKHEGKWGDAAMNLHRFHAFCAEASREDCEAVLANFVASATTPRPEPTAANLRVVVRNAGYLEHLLETLPEDARPIHRQIGDDLYALLAFAGPGGVLITIPEQLQALELDDAAAWRLANEQTRAVLPDLPYDIDLANHVVSFEDYDFLTSLLVDIEGWRGIARKAGPNLFATAISDISVWVGVMPDGPRFEQFKDAVRGDCAASERCTSPHVYRFREGRWVIAE